MTPRLTHHARERCAEMEIPTKVAKQIAQRGEVRYPGTRGREGGDTRVVLWSGEPEYCVVMDAEESVVITVLFRTTEYYARAGSTFVPRSA